MTETQEEKQHWVKIVFLSTFGSFLDFFDFAIFGLFAPYISKVFFVNDTHLMGLIKSYGILAVGYLARPLGGYIFGWFGDRHGRKNIFVLSILIMALSTLVIGLLPGYDEIGGWAIFLLLLFRFLQGASFGGELPGAVVFTSEHIRLHKGFGTSFIIAALNYGAACGGLIGAILNRFLSYDQMLSWGWRVPFFFGFLIGIIGYFVRRTTKETPAFEKLKKASLKSHPFLHLLKTDFPSFLIGLSLTAMSAIVIAFMIFLPSYFSFFQDKQFDDIFTLTAGLFITLAFWTPFFGYFSDLTGRRGWLIAGSFLSLAISFFLLQTEAIWMWVMLPFFASMNVGCYEISLAELFPTNTRYSGVGVCHNLGYGLFGGMGPLIFSLLVHWTGSLFSPFIYIAFGCIVTIIGAIFLRKAKATPAKGSQ